MSPEERDGLIQFILQSQSNAAALHEEAMHELKEHSAQLKEHSSQLREQSSQIQALGMVSHDLVEVARRHSQRLDPLDHLNP